MSMLNHTSDFSSATVFDTQIDQVFGRGIFRAVNTAIAVIIAQREHQASLTILRNLSDRDLRDIGLSRSQIGNAGSPKRQRTGCGRSGSWRSAPDAGGTIFAWSKPYPRDGWPAPAGRPPHEGA